MSHDTRNPASHRDSPSVFPGPVSSPVILSHSPFERWNGPEANLALQEIYWRIHGVVSLFLIGEALLAVIIFAQKSEWTLAIASAALPTGFGFIYARARTSTFSRQAAAFALLGIASLFFWGNDARLLGGVLFFVTLVVLALYQDPQCVWPAAACAVSAHLIAGATRLTTLSGDNPELQRLLTEAGLGFGATAAVAYGAFRQRKASLDSLRAQAVLTSENTRLIAELDRTRRSTLEQGRDSLGGSRFGWSRSPVGSDSSSSARFTEERYRLVIETAFDAIVIIDADSGVIVDLNPRALEMLGRARAEVIGQEHVILYAAAKAPVYRAIFKRASKGEVQTLEIELADRHGTTIPCEVAFSVSHLPRQRLVQGVFRDLTERKRAEAEKNAITTRLQEAQRLESLNVLAGGIAHDFNNILMSILGFASIGRDRGSHDPILSGYFAKIEISTLRAGELCRQMLAFAGRAQVSIHKGDLNEAIRSFEEPLRTKLPGNIQLEMHLWPELPPVNFDTAQLGQVIVSLVTNALEAIGDRSGLIQIKTFGSFADDPTRKGGFVTPEIPPDYCAVVEVVDTGGGIGPEHLPRIFEPFYSTKFIGRGLGLSETLGMIRSHHGAIQVKSKRGDGASFRLFFPAIPLLQTLEKPRASQPSPARSSQAPRLALVMDDEGTIRDLVGAMLEQAGFAVKYATNGTEGLDLFNTVAPQVDVVMLDLAMPGIPSHQVLEKIRGSGRPDLRVFIMSGYSEGDALERCGEHRPDGFLAKPFSAAHLKAALNA